MTDGVSGPELNDTLPTKLDQAAATAGPNPLIAPAAMEFVGCFIFIYTICMAVINGSGLAPLAIGGCLMVIIYMGGAVSGGHFNPAVTLGIFIRDDGFSVVQMGVYMVAQFLGGIFGGIVAFALFPGEDEIYEMGGAQIAPGTHSSGEEYGDFAALLNEFIYAFLLVSTVLNVATSPAPAYKNNSFFALAIGFSVVAGAAAGGGVSGGAYNPAVAFGVTVAHSMSGGSFENIWIPLIGDFAGGAVAAVFYRFVLDPHLRAN